jgi:hypothetical protein
MSRPHGWMPGAALVLAALITPALVGTTPASAQSLDDRIAAAPDGDVRFTFRARDGVCARSHEGGWVIRAERHDEWRTECTNQPIRVALTREGGRIIGLRHYMGGEWQAPEWRGVDLGTVSAPAAASYLVRLAASAEERVAEGAISSAAMADSADIWRPLLDIARSETRPMRVRRSATFWVGHAAGERMTAELNALVAEDSLDLDIREHAVFALSRRPREEAVPALIAVARGSAHPRIRERALFWLGQSRDDRALHLFEELLAGPRN